MKNINTTNEDIGFVSQSYTVQVLFPGSNGWQNIASGLTHEAAQEEINHQRTIEDEGSCEYQIVADAV